MNCIGEIVMKSYGVIADDKLVVNEKNLFTEKEAIERKEKASKDIPRV